MREAGPPPTHTTRLPFLREAGFEAYWREKGWPPQCRPLGDTDFECSPAPFEPLPAAAPVAAIMPTGSNGP